MHRRRRYVLLEWVMEELAVCCALSKAIYVHAEA